MKYKFSHLAELLHHFSDFQKPDCKQKKMKINFFRLSTAILSLTWTGMYAEKTDTAVDPNGYIVYCPCMGELPTKALHRSPDLIYS